MWPCSCYSRRALRRSSSLGKMFLSGLEQFSGFAFTNLSFVKPPPSGFGCEKGSGKRFNWLQVPRGQAAAPLQAPPSSSFSESKGSAFHETTKHFNRDRVGA